MTDEIKRLKELVDSSDNIVFFGGAGVSTESGIPDFRSTGGLYHQQWKYPPEVILSHTFYESNPEEFFRFYRAKMLAPDARPNAAHKKLAEWEAAGRLKAVITQNIDGLHQAAGSRKVLELHGSVHRNHCERCGKFYGLDDILRTEGVPRCRFRHRTRPESWHLPCKSGRRSCSFSGGPWLGQSHWENSGGLLLLRIPSVGSFPAPFPDWKTHGKPLQSTHQIVGIHHRSLGSYVLLSLKNLSVFLYCAEIRKKADEPHTFGRIF